MARIKTIVEVMRPVYNEKGEQLNKDGRPMDDPKSKKVQEPMLTSEHYELLHWGLQISNWYDENNRYHAINYTVGICSHLETGVVQTFDPREIRILGRDFKEAK